MSERLEIAHDGTLLLHGQRTPVSVVEMEPMYWRIFITRTTGESYERRIVGDHSTAIHALNWLDELPDDVLMGEGP